MIITSVSVKNLSKYELLELNNLPEKGVIGVSGHNESGKSSIGESICFALYGRTYSLEGGSLSKLIRWGEHGGSVTVGFKIKDKQYEISRTIDHDGSIGARLTLEGFDANPLARGVDEVNRELAGLLGFSFEEFLETFYLAQRETSSNPNQDAIRSMAGLTALAFIEQGYSKEANAERDNVENTQKKRADYEAKIADINIETGLLSSLEEQLDEAKQHNEKLRSQVTDLLSAQASYSESVNGAGHLRGTKSAGNFLAFVFFVIAVVMGVAWYLLSNMPEHVISTMIMPFVGAKYVSWLMFGGAGSGLLFVFFWIRVLSIKGKINAFVEPAKLLSERLESVHQAYLLATNTTKPQLGVMDLCRRISDATADNVEIHRVVEQQVQPLNTAIAATQTQVNDLDESVSKESERVHQASQLRAKVIALDAEFGANEKQMRQGEMAVELLKGASSHVLRQFNSELRELAAKVLPKFTENRYEHLQIADDLTVQVFSNKKRDFMALQEISAGTQRQIMLSLRFALAQELTVNAVSGDQFLFLDEPFAFFDDQRTIETLGVLSDLHKEIPQVWVVSQSFPGNHDFSLEIVCDGEQDKMIC